ncbi:ribosomal protein S5 domain 2-type protein [Hypoxylon sp. FL1150]|nr:ribosomal protein S5 domain 2-type protein [Hypoxylon sp. FL1150]
MAFVPTTQSEVQAWLQRFHAANDSLDPSRLGSTYAKDAKVQFGNMPVIEGLDGMRNFFSATWARLETMHHEPEGFDLVDNKIYQPCHITWQVKNDPEKEQIVVPAFAFISLVTSGEERGLISRAAFYMDGAPLMAALQRASDVFPYTLIFLSTTTMASSQSLTLSSATFAKLTPHPFLLANLQPPDPSIPSARTNGRQPAQARPYSVNTSSLTHAHGSAVVRSGDTTVICGVRGETLLTSQIPNYRIPQPGDSASNDELRDYELLVPNVELATGCSPHFLPGVPPTTLAQTLSTRLYTLLHSAKLLDAADLRIYQDVSGEEATEGEEDQAGEAVKEVKAYWVLYIDILFVSFDGNPFDVAWAAILAALRDTKLPQAYWDVDRETVLCSREAPSPLSIRGLPAACTTAVFTAKERQKKGDQFWVLVDPDRLEESLCDETVTMVVDCSSGETKILSISKQGGTVAGPAVVRKFATVAEARWKEFRAILQE